MRWLVAFIAAMTASSTAFAGGQGVGTSGNAGGSTGGNATIVSWAIGASDGGVRPPAGTTVSQCTRWTVVSFGDPSLSGVSPGATTRRLPSGEVETLYWRSCNGRLQYVWVGQYSARQVAQLAYQRVIGQLPKPQPEFAPPADAMIVNLDTWFGATPTGNIAATARVPGLASTVTARPQRLVLDTGSRVAGDQRVVECPVWGSTAAASGGCAWTPRWPSVARVTGTNDQRYQATLTIVWSIDWQATNGQRGNLGEVRTTTPTPITVREVQTTS
jgi:hypothetical protein